MTLEDIYAFLIIIGFITITTLAIKWFIVDVRKYFKGESYKPLKFPKERMWSILGTLFKLSTIIFLFRQAIIYDTWYWWLILVLYTFFFEERNDRNKQLKKEEV